MLIVYFIRCTEAALWNRMNVKNPPWTQCGRTLKGHALHSLTATATMKIVKEVACVILLCLVVVRCQQHENRDRGAFDGPGRPDRGKLNLEQLNRFRRSQGEGGEEDLEYKRYLQELMANNPG